MAQRAFIKKGDLIFVLAFLAFVAGVLWYRQTQPPVEGNWAVVTVDSQEVARYELSAHQESHLAEPLPLWGRGGIGIGGSPNPIPRIGLPGPHLCQHRLYLPGIPKCGLPAQQDGHRHLHPRGFAPSSLKAVKNKKEPAHDPVPSCFYGETQRGVAGGWYGVTWSARCFHGSGSNRRSRLSRRSPRNLPVFGSGSHTVRPTGQFPTGLHR